jgi:hypothetical protein
MNEKKQAVLDAARNLVTLYNEQDQSWDDIEAAICNMASALDALPDDAGSETERVRDVADLRDGETVLLWEEEWTVQDTGGSSPYLVNEEQDLVFAERLVPLAVAAGAVTRPPKPELDPEQVKRLAAAMRHDGSNDAPWAERERRAYARQLLRAGVRLPEGPS